MESFKRFSASNIFRWNKLLLIFLICVFALIHGQVVEVDDSFQEKKQDYAWLLEFYAPWCGHCRKLESTYHQVYLGLKGSAIIVARVDATRFPSLASAYDVRGYPTIKFIQGNKIITYNGDRSKEDIIEFSRKAFGPSLSAISSAEMFSNTRNHLSRDVFFVYVLDSLSPTSSPDSKFEVYKQVAEKFAITSNFFFISKENLAKDVIVGKVPGLLVFKDGHHSEFDGLTSDLEQWINVERFSVFPSVGGIGLNDMSSLNRMLVIFVHDQHSSEWYDILLNVAKKLKNSSDKYQFVWLKDVEVGNSIIMSNLDSPFLFILNTSDHSFISYPFDQPTEELVETFLDDVILGKYSAHGGRSFVERVKRLVYDIVMTIHSIYKESVWLAMLVFGVPLLVISVICYTLCCIDPIDDAVYDDSYSMGDEDYYDQHEETLPEPESVEDKKEQ